MKRNPNGLRGILAVLLMALCPYVGAATGSETLEHQFRNPPDDCKPMPLWFINGQLTTEGIRQQITQAKTQAGFTGISPLPWSDVKPSFLSEAYFDRYKDIVETARQLDMQVILYDDAGFPSGMAGGKMAIYTGLINKLNATDDEIAQVMGHEISHALANHTAERMSIALATQLGLSGVAIAATDSVYKGAILSGSALAAATAITLPNSRTAESEADQMGIELAARAGYDPRAAVTLWQKMARVGGDGPPQFLSTHPSPANRQEKLSALANQMMGYYLDKSPRPVYPLQ